MLITTGGYGREWSRVENSEARATAWRQGWALASMIVVICPPCVCLATATSCGKHNALKHGIVKCTIEAKEKVSQSLLPVTLARCATLVYTCCMLSHPNGWDFANRLTHAPSSIIAYRRQTRSTTVNTCACFARRRASCVKMGDQIRSRKTDFHQDQKNESIDDLPLDAL